MTSDSVRHIELLAPARDIETAMAAIAHGADAVYIGPPAHGARRAAGNSLDDLQRLVEYAHPFRVRIYATVNTLVYPDELLRVERMIWQLYRIGIDALIVQDMSLLRMDIPPIELHASTQCDIRTPRKARFLQEAGFSQLVLARELTSSEIASIVNAVSVSVECFVHGALCVCYSGRCHASQSAKSRSANRGDCAQLCRLPYTLTDARGDILCRDRHLLSLHDLNLSQSLESLLKLGVSSFKIEGRLKEVGYVKNIVAYYRRRLDEIFLNNPDKYKRSSYGISEIPFTPDPAKSFNRGFTTYFFERRRPDSLASLYTPKSLGEPIRHISQLNNGDGVAYFDKKHNYVGARVNSVSSGRISTYGNKPIPDGVRIYRTYDVRFDREVSRSQPERRIGVVITMRPGGVDIRDCRGVSATVSLPQPAPGASKNVSKLREIFSKLGNTRYKLNEFVDLLPDNYGYPASTLTAIRRELLKWLDIAAAASYSYGHRRNESRDSLYPDKHLTFADNVANPLAEQFYRDHGVEGDIPQAMEVSGAPRRGSTVMTCRHCILHELGRCLKHGDNLSPRLPLTLACGDIRFNVLFDCDRCEMRLTTL